MKKTRYKPGNAEFLSQCHAAFCQKWTLEARDEAMRLGEDPHCVPDRFYIGTGEFSRLIEGYPDIGLYYPILEYGRDQALCPMDHTYFVLVSRIGKHGTDSMEGRRACVDLVEFLQHTYSDAVFYAKRAVRTSKDKVSLRLKVFESRVDHRRNKAVFFFTGYGRDCSGSIYRTSMTVAKAAERFGTLQPRPGTLVEFRGRVKSTVDNKIGAKHPYVGALLVGNYWVKR